MLDTSWCTFREVLVGESCGSALYLFQVVDIFVMVGSVELPKTTHLPKTTENHLENHIYRVIIPSLYVFFSSLCLYISIFNRMDRKNKK